MVIRYDQPFPPEVPLVEAALVPFIFRYFTVSGRISLPSTLWVVRNPTWSVVAYSSFSLRKVRFWRSATH